MTGTARFILLAVWFGALGCLAAPPQRIVSTVPSLTEMLFAIGAGDQVVGDTEFCRYPPAAAQLEKVGGYVNLSFEKLLSLKPDLVVMADYSRHLREQCAAAHLPALTLPTNSTDEILDSIRKLGAATGHEPQARTLAAGIRLQLEKVRASSAGRPPRRTLLIIGRTVGSFQGMLAAGPGGFLNDLLNAAGGTNVLADVNQPWPQINLESVLARKPEAIIELMGEHMTQNSSAATVEARKKDWRQFPGLPAVAAGRVGVLLSNHALIPGPRIADTARGLAELLR